MADDLTMSPSRMVLRRSVAEVLLATQLVLSLAVVVGKGADLWMGRHLPGVMDSVGLGAHLVVVFLMSVWRIRPAMYVLVAFGLCSIAWHAAGFGPGCRCLGLLDRLGASSPTVWASGQGLVAVLVLFLAPRSSGRGV